MADRVLASWLENKQMLTDPKELKTVLYAAWMGLKAGAYSLFTHAFTLACFIIVLILKPFFLYKPTSFLFNKLELGAFFLYFLIVCALRASVPLKDNNYYISRVFTHFYFYIILALIFKLMSFWLTNYISYYIYLINTSAFLTLFLLFFLDNYSRNFMTALRQAALFFYYNYPLVLLVQVSYVLVKQLIEYSLSYLFPGSLVILFVSFIIDLVLFMLYAALISSVYIKRLYQQLKLYVE